MCSAVPFFHATLPDMDDDIIIIKEHYGQRARCYLLSVECNGGQHCYFYLKNASMCEIIILPPGIPLSYFIRQYIKKRRNRKYKKMNSHSSFSSLFLLFFNSAVAASSAVAV